jgi:hypothetical protein
MPRTFSKQTVDSMPTKATRVGSRRRFWNNKVLANTDGVLVAILDALRR